MTTDHHPKGSEHAPWEAAGGSADTQELSTPSLVDANSRASEVRWDRLLRGESTHARRRTPAAAASWSSHGK